jgi:CDP-diacylglycerol---serine O-phosphatidyltransferase
LDGLDGRVARMTSTQSAFGAEYDSLSDMVSFGVAPALVIYEWALKDLGKLGWVAAFVYVAGGALRLARFNTQLDNPDKRFFQGIPTPSAAALVAGFVWVMNERLGLHGSDVPYLAVAMPILVGLTMVSNIPYYSFKTVNLKQSIPFITLVVLALGFAVVMSEPAVIFALFVMYWIAGALYALQRLYKRTTLPRLPKS